MNSRKKCNDRFIITRVIIPFSAWTIIFQMIPAIMERLFSPDQWFFTLENSPASPPRFLFNIVWPFLYFSLSTYGWYISYELKKSNPYRVLFALFFIQMILNWAYTPVLFGLKSTVGAFICGLIPAIITGYLIAFPFYYSKNWALSILLIPYFIWCSYASYLSGYIIANN